MTDMCDVATVGTRSRANLLGGDGGKGGREESRKLIFFVNFIVS